jgi:hypothetical protein
VRFHFPIIAYLMAGALLAGASQTVPCETLWRKVGGSTRKSITSNPGHFWAWAKENAQGHLGDYMAPEGMVIGDLHLRNVFDYRSGGRAELAVADIDDGGRGPLILDLARYAVFLKAERKDIKIAQVFSAYTDGLKGKALPEPNLLAWARELNANDIKAKHLRYVEKNSENGRFNFERLELSPPEKFNSAQRRESRELGKKVLEKTGAKKIWDVGLTQYDSGSSAGLARYWYLVGSMRAPNAIVEGKLLSEPGLSYFQPQKVAAERVAELTLAFSKNGLAKPFGVARAAGKDYWVRPRKFQALDLNNEEVSWLDEEEFALYVANWLGRRQRDQPAGKALLKKIEKNEGAAKDAVRDFVRDYLSEIER